MPGPIDLKWWIRDRQSGIANALFGIAIDPQVRSSLLNLASLSNTNTAPPLPVSSALRGTESQESLPLCVRNGSVSVGSLS